MRTKKSGKWTSFKDLPKNYESLWIREKDNKDIIFKLDLKNMTLAEIDNEVVRLSETAEYLKKINKMNEDSSWHDFSYD